MSDLDRGGFYGLISGLVMGAFFLLLTAIRPENALENFWFFAALTGVVILLRITIAIYYAGVRKGSNTQTKED